jgi:hypothetical protein
VGSGFRVQGFGFNLGFRGLGMGVGLPVVAGGGAVHEETLVGFGRRLVE